MVKGFDDVSTRQTFKEHYWGSPMTKSRPGEGGEAHKLPGTKANGVLGRYMNMFKEQVLDCYGDMLISP